LFAEEEILGSEGGRGSKPQIHERHCVNKNGEDGESENTSVAEHERKNLMNRANEYGGEGFSAGGGFGEHRLMTDAPRLFQAPTKGAATNGPRRAQPPHSPFHPVTSP